MTKTRDQLASPAGDAATDVFAAARWLDELWNSSAKAVSPDEIEWQCNTWGSGRGRGDWMDAVKFRVAVPAFGLRFWRNRDGRDELVVGVPLDQFSQIKRLINGLGAEDEAWPWLDEDDVERQISLAAEALEMTPRALGHNHALLEALCIL